MRYRQIAVAVLCLLAVVSSVGPAWGASPALSPLPRHLPEGLASPFPGPVMITLSNGLKVDSSGNLMINAGMSGSGTVLSNGLTLDSSGNVFVNCAVGCNTGGGFTAANNLSGNYLSQSVIGLTFGSSSYNLSATAPSAGQILFAASSSSVAGNSRLIDSGTVFSYTGTGGITAPVLGATGSGAGLSYTTQGTDNSASCPANSDCSEAPASISTAFTRVGESAGPSALSLEEYSALSGGKTTKTFASLSGIFASPPAIGGTAPAAALFTTLDGLRCYADQQAGSGPAEKIAACITLLSSGGTIDAQGFPCYNGSNAQTWDEGITLGFSNANGGSGSDGKGHKLLLNGCTQWNVTISNAQSPAITMRSQSQIIVDKGTNSSNGFTVASTAHMPELFAVGCDTCWVPISSITSNGTTATITFSASIPSATSKQIILYGVTDQSDFPNGTYVMTCSGTTCTYANTASASSSGGAGGFGYLGPGGAGGSIVGLNAAINSSATLPVTLHWYSIFQTSSLENINIGCPTGGIGLLLDGAGVSAGPANLLTNTIDCAGATGSTQQVINSAANGGSIGSFTDLTSLHAHSGANGTGILLEDTGGNYQNDGFALIGAGGENSPGSTGLVCNHVLGLSMFNPEFTDVATGPQAVSLTNGCTGVNIYGLHTSGFTNSINDTSFTGHTYANTDLRIAEYHLLDGVQSPSFDDAYWGFGSTNTAIGGPSGMLFSIGKQSNGANANQLCLHFLCPQETTTSVTVAGAVSTAQNLQTVPVNAVVNPSGTTGGMGVAVGNTFNYRGAGTYTTGASGAGTMVFTLHACTVTGCGSGTDSTLVTFPTTGTQPASQTAIPWTVDITCYATVLGSAGDWRCFGNLTTNLTSPSTPGGVYQFVGTAGVSINTTVTQFLQLKVADSGASANNSFTQYDSSLYAVQ